MKDKLVLLAKEKGYYSFHTVNREVGDGWFIELCLLQKWIREKHNIHISMIYNDNCYYTEICDCNTSQIYRGVSNNINFEDALENTLQAACKLINNERI